jgi:hypothetical protein
MPSPGGGQEGGGEFGSTSGRSSIRAGSPLIRSGCAPDQSAAGAAPVRKPKPAANAMAQ